jgi:choline dehydrogenase
MLQWLVLGTGVMASPPMVISANVATVPGCSEPDMHFLLVPVAMNAHLWFPGIRRQRGHILMASYSLNYPKSRGHLELKSSDATVKPAIHFDLLTDPEDLRAMIRGYRLLRELLSQAPLTEIIGRTVRPANVPYTDNEIEAYVRASAATAFHPAGTCRMGADAKSSVINPDHRTHDVPNLFLCDGSSLVTSGRGQPTMTIQALAYRAADRITALAKQGNLPG